MLLNTDIGKKPVGMASQSYYSDSAVLSSYNSTSTIFDSGNVSQKTDVVFGKQTESVGRVTESTDTFDFSQCHHLADFIPLTGSTTPGGKLSESFLR